MIPNIRQEYNRLFTKEKYQSLLHSTNETFRFPVSFRISETPLFAPRALKDKLSEACDGIIDFILQKQFKEITNPSIPAHLKVPHETTHPHFLALDFALIRDNNGDISPRLIEMQGFPSLFAFQFFISEQYQKIMHCPPNWNSLFDISADEYKSLFHEVVVGSHNPENVVLLEYDPFNQNTAIDFVITEHLTKIKILDISDVKKSDRQLYYEMEGRKIPIHRIYNRVIFDELLRHPELNLAFNLVEDVDVEWAGHPNWFFRISKFTMPFIQNEYIPTTRFLNELNELPPDLSNYVLKPLFSFSGQGVIYNVTKEDIDVIKDQERSNYILQQKVSYEPVVQAPDGAVKAEIRMLYIWRDGDLRPKAVTNLVRLSRGEMIGVRYNKDKTWVGGSVCFFEP